MGGTTANKRKQIPTNNGVTWFEIPAINFQQSVNFYSSIFAVEMELNITGNYAMAFFPSVSNIAGAIVSGPGSTPGDAGPLLYLHAGSDLNVVLNRVEQAGGRVVMSKTLINQESGHYAIFLDSEGNKIALHSIN